MNEGSRRGGIIAQYTPIIVTWASSDLDRFTPASAPVLHATPASKLLISASIINTRAGSLGNVGATSTAQTSNSSSLSTGAQAGIGVGVTIVCICAMSAIIWTIFRRRKSRKGTEDAQMSLKPELHGESKSAANGGERSELDDDAKISEIIGTSRTAEVDDSQRHELPGDFGAHEVRGDADIYSRDMAKIGR